MRPERERNLNGEVTSLRVVDRGRKEGRLRIASMTNLENDLRGAII